MPPASSSCSEACKTDDALIAAGKDVDAFLIQYAPVTERVDYRAARNWGWSAGSGQASTPSISRPAPSTVCGSRIRLTTVSARWQRIALSLALALVRNVTGF